MVASCSLVLNVCSFLLATGSCGFGVIVYDCRWGFMFTLMFG